MCPMSPQDSMAAVESRAFALRLTMAELCAAAGVKQSVWSRAKHRGTVSPRLLGRMESCLAALESQRQEPPAAEQAA